VYTKIVRHGKTHAGGIRGVYLTIRTVGFRIARSDG
jgi:hypothetical protein